MKVMGIDASTTCSGIGVIENGKLIYHGVIDMKKNRNVEDRIMKMMSALGNVIKEYKPDALYIEDSWKQQNVQTTKMLSNVVGAVMYVCSEIGCKFVKILPSSWRSKIGIKMNDNNGKIKRDELKLEAVIKIYDKYGIKCTDDEAEGICITGAGWLLETDKNLFD